MHPDSLHPYEILQLNLLKKQVIPAGISGYYPESGDRIFTADIQYQGEQAFVAIDVCEWPGKPESIYLLQTTPTEPYVPGFFSFREGPLIEEALQLIADRDSRKPDLLLVDGHGTAHPRKMGLASWLGIRQEVPTIGIAKEHLLPRQDRPGSDAGSAAIVVLGDEIVGHEVRTQTGINPVFVSAGHLVSQQNTVRITLALRSSYRIIEPIRRADQAARLFARKEPLPQAIIL